jgi:hypothetical protein
MVTASQTCVNARRRSYKWLRTPDGLVGWGRLDGRACVRALAACSRNGRATGTNVHTLTHCPVCSPGARHRHRHRHRLASKRRSEEQTDPSWRGIVLGGRGYRVRARRRWAGVLAWRRHRAPAHTCAPPRRRFFNAQLLELISTSWPNGQLGP